MTSTATNERRIEVAVQGIVQGVGFRPFVYREARRRGLRGWVSNGTDGVRIEAQGDAAALDAFVDALRARPPECAVVERLDVRMIERAEEDTFRIRGSESSSITLPTLPADLGTCAECFAEVADPAAHRYGYPFTNCTRCGPRFTIVESLPYDRPRTSMKRFPMCRTCRCEYEDPADRRFHAQPVACPACGPHLSLLAPNGRTLAERDEALHRAARAVRDGGILALKGIGGFQLVADASSNEAVRILRKRKRRPDKPFALMLASVDAAREHCDVSAEEEDLLRSAIAPIVLLPRWDGTTERAVLAGDVAPGSARLGVMLPYTPLHRLLVERVNRPLVCTSGNVAEEPLCVSTEEALERLRGIADLHLTNDRPVVRPVDDSVTIVTEGTPQVLRRARGYAPSPLLLPDTAPPALAMGAHLKSTVALRLENRVIASQHLGDLSTLEGVAQFERTVDDLLRFYDTRPAVLACDLHPDYASTRHAERLRDEWSVPLVRVQHHHAHVESLRAEHGLKGEVLGLSWDGTGYGADGTVWGGEALASLPGGFRRVARLRPFLLPGGERAIQEPRRSALGLLHGLRSARADDVAAALFAPNELGPLRTMLEGSVNSPLTSSVGRLFDAVAALAGLRARVSFEGQAAMELQSVLEHAGAKRLLATAGAYPLPLDDGEPAAADWEPLIEAVLQDVARGTGPETVSARFHNALASHATDAAGHAGLERVLLSGGCFQNPVLTACVRGCLERRGLRVFTHRRVPPNDGGISVGQIVVAAAFGEEKS